MKEIECVISGRVQLVMYRDFTKRKAESLGLTGYVQNMTDGTVHVIAQGREQKLRTLITLLHRGSFLAHVDSVSVEWREPTQQFERFIITY